MGRTYRSPERTEHPESAEDANNATGRPGTVQNAQDTLGNAAYRDRLLGNGGSDAASDSARSASTRWSINFDRVYEGTGSPGRGRVAPPRTDQDILNARVRVQPNVGEGGPTNFSGFNTSDQGSVEMGQIDHPVPSGGTIEGAFDWMRRPQVRIRVTGPERRRSAQLRAELRANDANRDAFSDADLTSLLPADAQAEGYRAERQVRRSRSEAVVLSAPYSDITGPSRVMVNVEVPITTDTVQSGGTDTTRETESRGSTETEGRRESETNVEMQEWEDSVRTAVNNTLGTQLQHLYSQVTEMITTHQTETTHEFGVNVAGQLNGGYTLSNQGQLDVPLDLLDLIPGGSIVRRVLDSLTVNLMLQVSNTLQLEGLLRAEGHYDYSTTDTITERDREQVQRDLNHTHTATVAHMTEENNRHVWRQSLTHTTENSSEEEHRNDRGNESTNQRSWSVEHEREVAQQPRLRVDVRSSQVPPSIPTRIESPSTESGG